MVGGKRGQTPHGLLNIANIMSKRHKPKCHKLVKQQAAHRNRRETPSQYAWRIIDEHHKKRKGQLTQIDICETSDYD